MIRVAALIEELSQVGVTLSKNGDEIVLDGPAVVLTDDLIEELRAHKSEILATFGEWDTADWQAFFDERAGIVEFDGDVSRQEAEDHALECCIVEWLNRHREPSDPSQCAHCRRPDDLSMSLCLSGPYITPGFIRNVGRHGTRGSGFRQ